MGKKLFTINTVNNFMGMIFEPFGKPFLEANPDISITNIMDDSLLRETLAAAGPTADVANRMLNYAQTAQAHGADGVLVTCTSVNDATRYIRRFLRIPILNIEEPVAEQAMAGGTRIGVLGTIPTSPVAIGAVIRAKAEEKGKKVELINRVAEGAFDVLCAGDRDRHDEMVRDALYALAKEVDVVAFAQISMSLLRHDAVPVPVYKIGASGFAKIKDLMN